MTNPIFFVTIFIWEIYARAKTKAISIGLLIVKSKAELNPKVFRKNISTGLGNFAQSLGQT